MGRVHIRLGNGERTPRIGSAPTMRRGRYPFPGGPCRGDLQTGGEKESRDPKPCPDFFGLPRNRNEQDSQPGFPLATGAGDERVSLQQFRKDRLLAITVITKFLLKLAGPWEADRRLLFRASRTWPADAPIGFKFHDGHLSGFPNRFTSDTLIPKASGRRRLMNQRIRTNQIGKRHVPHTQAPDIWLNDHVDEWVSQPPLTPAARIGPWAGLCRSACS